MLLILPFVIILVSVAFLYLFVCVDEHGKGVPAKAKTFFWFTLPAFLKSVVRKICGQRFVWLIERTFRYICHEPNPLVQVIY